MLGRSTFYFAGRPVAELDRTPTGAETWRWFTTDHLGTPVLATNSAGNEIWRGGFEPFGEDFSGASAAGIGLRLPGQLADAVWGNASLGASVVYNVHRWYTPRTGRFGRPDPWGNVGPLAVNHLYSYALGNPLNASDPLGLRVVIEDPGVQESYQRLKECSQFFRVLMTNFEQDTGFLGRPVEWTVRTPDWFEPDCQAKGRRNAARTVWIPLNLKCRDTMKCLLHEFYELWLINKGGFDQRGSAGLAHDRARAAESWFKEEECCPCAGGSTSGGMNAR